MKGPLPRFVVTTLLLLPLTFALWYFAGPLFTWPVRLIVDAVARMGFADIVRSVEQQASVITFVTSLRPGSAQGAGAISVDVNALLYSYGMPMFAALTLAARERGYARKLALGIVVLLPLVAWGVLADFLKNIAFTAGPLVASQTGFSLAQRQVIAFAYQFGALILPTVAPAAVWVLMHRGLLERMRAASGTDAQPE
ncbi:MAG: exosortase H-associated membrane protein [Betaproteobacteria bacterium]